MNNLSIRTRPTQVGISLLCIIFCSHAARAEDSAMVRVTTAGIAVGKGKTSLTTAAAPSLAWRYPGESKWSESSAATLEDLRVGPDETSFTAKFPETRADITVTRLRPDLWRLSGKLVHTGSKPIELARFHYLDGNIQEGLGHLELPGGDRFPRLVKAGDRLPPPGPTTEKMWADWNVKLPRLTDPVHHAPDWSIGRDTGVFTTAWDQPGWTVGFTGPGTAFGEIGFRTTPSPQRFFVGVLLDNILMEPGESRPLENALLHHGDWQEGMKLWAKDCAREFNAPAAKPPLAGYCSWYQRGHNVEVADLLRAAEELKPFPTPPGGKVVQVDDGWQIKPGNWRPNEKFAADWKSLPDRIRQTGSMAGMYLVPTAVHESDPIVQEHPEWLQRMPDGEFAVHFGNWGGKTYFLEIDHPEVKEFIRSIFQRSRDEGWEYIKIDFTYGFSTARTAYNRKKTSFESQRDLYALFREAAGPKILLNACVGEPARYALGLADVNRMGGDTGSDWGAVRDNLRRMLVLSPTFGTWGQADPDVFYMRSENSSLNSEESYLLTGTIGMLGGTFITSDFPSQWTTEAQDAVRDFWTETRPQPPAEHRVLWTSAGVPLSYRASDKAGNHPRHRIGLYNWAETAEDRSVRLEDLGLDGSTSWKLNASAWSQGIRLEDGRLIFRQQPPHSLRIAELSQVE